MRYSRDGNISVLVACSAPSHYLNQCWFNALTHICGRWGHELIAPEITISDRLWTDSIVSMSCSFMSDMITSTHWIICLTNDLHLISKALWSMWYSRDGNISVLVACSAPSHYLNQCWFNALTHICGRWGDELIAPEITISDRLWTDSIVSMSCSFMSDMITSTHWIIC